MKLPELGVKRPVTVMMLFLGILLMGLVSVTMLPIDLMPEMEPPAISVLISWFGASAEDVERKVTKYVEKNLSIVNNLDEIRSLSKDNLSMVTCEFEWGTDLDEAANDIRDRLEFAKKDLPDDIEVPIIFKFNTSMFPILFYGVTADESWEKLFDIADDDIAEPLQRVPGVGAVQNFGGIERQVNIRLDRDKLTGYGLTLRDVERVLRAENLSLPAGTLKIGTIEYSLRVPGEYESPAEIENIVLKRHNGAMVYLRDVAEVEDSFKEKRRFVMVDGREGLMVIVQKRSGANTAAVCSRVKKEMEEIKKNLPRDVKVALLMDSSEFIVQSLRNLSETVMWGGFFVVLVSFIFLRNFRMSLVIVLTIPFSLIVAFIIMYVMGYTINMVSLSSLAIAIGMVVDNAVVVLENVVSHVERGEPVRESSMFGASEVGLAITASTFTTVVVFLPLMFVHGITGVIFKQLAVILSGTVLASLFCATTLTPMLCSKFIKPIGEMLPKRRFFRRLYEMSERGFEAIERVYLALLRLALGNKGFVLGVASLAFVGSLMLIPFIGTEFVPETDTGDLSIAYETPVGTRVEETARVGLKILDVLKKVAGEKYIEHGYMRCGESESGLGSAFGFKEGTHVGYASLKLVKKTLRDISTEEIGRRVADEIKSWPSVVKLSVDTGALIDRVLLGGAKPISVEILGHDIDETNKLAAQIKEIVVETRGSKDVTISRDPGKPELSIRVDRQKAASLGLNITDIVQSLRTLFYGKEATKYHEMDEDYDIFMRLSPAQRRSIEDVRSATVTTPSGRKIHLDTIADVVQKLTPVQIDRKDQERIVKVEADTYGRSLGEVMADIERRINKEVEIPPDVRIKYGGMVKEQRESFRDMTMLLLMGIVLVYMVMASQFESLKHPFVVMFSVPFAFVGVLVFLAMTGTTLNIMSFIGVVMLMGIVVNNAIVLIDYTNILRARGLGLMEAVIGAGERRLRPVLITTLTTIFGMTPLALSRGEGSEVWVPLGLTVIGGLLLSSLVTLILVPIIYTMVEARAERRRVAQT